MSLNPMDWIEQGFNYFLYNFFYRLFYLLEIAFCKALVWLQELMDVFTGTSMVKYKTTFGSSENYLINLFFQNSAISGVYWGMAAIGVVLAFLFALVSVIRKIFDIGDKVKMSYSQILRNLFKSILLILLLNGGMSVIITATNVLMQQIVYVFDHSEDLTGGSDHIDFTNEQYAAMARIFNTVGNYSLNPSYKSRYNLNSCYNDIRTDLKYLADTGVFNYYYEKTDENGNIVPTWQSALQNLANAADYNVEAPVDVYNEGIANAITGCMDLLKTNASLEALESYDRIEVYDSNSVYLDRVMFIVGTMGNGITGAARNNSYNQHPSMTDAVRAPYYRGAKSIYDFDSVNGDFDIALHKTNYFVVYVAGVALVANMALILVSCVARIFNLLFLYVIAPPLFAIMPLDDGGKVKQWLTAFLVQAFSVFATVISMRLYLLFIPLILDPGLQISENIIIDIVGRLVLLYAGAAAINKANGILTGILADSAGWQSITAGDMQGFLGNSLAGRLGRAVTGKIGAVPEAAAGLAVGAATGAAKGVGKGAWWGTKKALSPVGRSIKSGLGAIGRGIGRGVGAMGRYMRGGGSAGGNKGSVNDKLSGGGGSGNKSAVPPPQRNAGQGVQQSDNKQ